MTGLTAPQAKVLAYLQRAGWGTSRSVSRFLWGTPRRRGSAKNLCERMVALGVIEHHPDHDGYRPVAED